MSPLNLLNNYKAILWTKSLFNMEKCFTLLPIVTNQTLKTANLKVEFKFTSFSPKSTFKSNCLISKIL